MRLNSDILPQSFSPYLVNQLKKPKSNIYNYVKWSLVRDLINANKKQKPRILDVGCAAREGLWQLKQLGFDCEYFGMDREAQFSPDLVGDMREFKKYKTQLPWTSDFILLLDVLEHLEGGLSDIQSTLSQIRESLSYNTTILIAVPNLYRLDCLKLKHLYYPEHKVRFALNEWENIICKEFSVKRRYPLGFISVLPYLMMAFSNYKNDNSFGRFFKYTRDIFMEKKFLRLKEIDYMFTKLLGYIPNTEYFSNDVVFECTLKCEKNIVCK